MHTVKVLKRKNNYYNATVDKRVSSKGIFCYKQIKLKTINVFY